MSKEPNPFDDFKSCIPHWSNDELKKMSELINFEINSRKEIPAGVTVRFETQKSFNPKPHGAAYVAILKPDGKGGVDRLWVNNNGRSYDGRKKTYFTSFTVETNEDTYLEARLKSSTYEDKREYYVIHDGQAIRVDREEAIRTSEKKEDF
jgi:hypothetical protein